MVIKCGNKATAKARRLPALLCSWYQKASSLLPKGSRLSFADAIIIVKVIDRKRPASLQGRAAIVYHEQAPITLASDRINRSYAGIRSGISWGADR